MSLALHFTTAWQLILIANLLIVGSATENIESIVKVAGVDAVLIGPYDLSASLGKMGQMLTWEAIDER